MPWGRHSLRSSCNLELSAGRHGVIAIIDAVNDRVRLGNFTTDGGAIKYANAWLQTSLDLVLC